jgi:hypothetical protein
VSVVVDVVVDVTVVVIGFPCTVITGVVVITWLIVDLSCITDNTVDVGMGISCGVDATCVEQP